MLKTYTVHVQTTGLMALFHRLLEMTITVIVVVLTLHHQHKHFTPMYYGRGKDVYQQFFAVLIVVCHGSARH